MIQELLLQNEGQNLEFKESAKSLSGIIKTIVAFANTSGGILVIGVEDKTKKVVGIQNILNEEERLANAIADSIAPLMRPSIFTETYRKKEVIIINVPYLGIPHYVKASGQEAGTYIRLGSTNRAADAAIREEFRFAAKIKTFDSLANPRENIESLDWDAMKKAFREANKPITENKAENLKIITPHVGKLCPTNGGIILFGINRERLFPYSIVRCARFNGTTKAEIFDHRNITSYPTIAIEETIHFIEKNTIMGAEFGRIKRIDIPQYPPIAIREAIMNAIMHADYANPASYILIAIFDDRIEITNPGGLPFGMTIEKAIGGSSSIRNPVIAGVFRTLNFTESYGSGLDRIIQACAKDGFKKPDFEDGIIDFKVTLYATKETKEVVDNSQKEFIKLLEKKKKISTKVAAEYWGVSPRYARVKLKTLLDAGLIKKVGTSAKDPRGGFILAAPNKKK